MSTKRTTAAALVPLQWCEVCEENVVATVPAVAHPVRVCARCLEGEQDVLQALREDERLAPRPLRPWGARS